MSEQKRIRRFWGCISMMAALIIIMAGCASLENKNENAAADRTLKDKRESSPLYYDFGDILIPGELKVDPKVSFVYRTPTFSAGVIVLNGNVDTASLVAFFEKNMIQDNWVSVSTFKSPRTVLLFQKESRWCVINITDKELGTHTEIWVAPTLGGPETGLLK